MADIAHKRTDKILEDLEKRIAKEYKQAGEEVERKMTEYLADIRKRGEVMRQKMLAGEISKQEYRRWMTSHIAVGKRWQEMRDNLAQDYANAGKIARKMTGETLPDVYALNHNFAAWEIETKGRVDLSYTLYDRHTVERLIRDNPKLLPDPNPNTARGRMILEHKELQWNRQEITSAVTQGILQGEPVHKIADRMAQVTDRNYAGSIRNARTAVTSAQNGGRMDCYRDAEKMGIDIRKTWVATLDDRTRHAHRQLHGQTVALDEPFRADGYEIMFPGDPAADPAMLYNCRCTMISQIKGHEVDVPKTAPGLEGITFDEWQKGKNSPKWEEARKRAKG